MNLLALTALSLLLVATQAQLQLYSSGPFGKPIQILSDGDRICPDDYPTGLNIRCKGSDTDRTATFTLNGKERKPKRRAPFFIAGNKRTIVKAWKGYTEVATVMCELASASYTAMLTFSCPIPATPEPSPEPTPEPSPVPVMAAPGTMYFRAAGAGSSTENQVEIVRGISFCPMRDVGSDSFTVFCTPSDTSAKAVFRINTKKVGKDFQTPYYIAGDEAGVPNAWTTAPSGSFTLVCALGGGIKSQIRRVIIECPVMLPTTPTPEPEMMPTAEPESDGCVIIQAKGAMLSDGWVDDQPDGVTFRPNNRSKDLTGAGVSPIYYKFTAPLTSRFALALDMTTRGRADFNDVHMRFSPGGWQLMSKAQTSVSFFDWIKGYHSIFGRAAKVASQVDHVPHSVSTGAILQKGQEYEVAISGRSNRLTLHQILLFPCAGSGCRRHQWKPTQEMCLPGSTKYTPRPRRNA